MEGGSVAIRSYWYRRAYMRLEPPVMVRQTKRLWKMRVRLTPKVKIFKFIASPNKALRRLRDGYIGMMLGFAKTSICTTGVYYRGRATSCIDQAVCGFGKPQFKEYDRKVIVEIYRTRIAEAAGDR